MTESIALAYVSLEEVPTTDDLLHRVLPLFRQVAALHERGRVAPLEGLDHLRALGGVLYFEEAQARAPRTVYDAVDPVEPRADLWLDVVSRHEETRTETGARVARDRAIWRGEGLPTTPSFMPGLDAWERVRGHHDPLTDIHLLGLHAARLAVGLALEDPEELETFVAARPDLRSLNPALHPVVVRALREMTEPIRARRPADLPGLVRTLERYREHEVTEVATETASDAQAAICERLRNRLFDLSRRNRLLYFKPSGKTLDLTVASVPLVLDHRSIDGRSLAVWNERFAAKLAKGLSLATVLRFEDYPYVVPALDAIRLQAGRDLREYGFSRLRLVACFLHWRDLGDAQHEPIRSPLLLVPVSLSRQKGVRDTFVLRASGAEMEVNPVLRHRLRQRYGIELPESIPLGDPEALDALHTSLRDQIQASEPAVTLERIDKPRVRLVTALARRRLATFQRRRRVARGGRSYAGLDYSYRRDAYAPLGIQLFHQRVVPARAPNRELLEAPRPRPFQLGPGEREVKKELYSLDEGEDGPHQWAFDCCRVTLANFNTKKMSLVADYTALIEEGRAPRSFEDLFHPGARPLEKPEELPPVSERKPVVPADPTQLLAVARARAGASYIVQGPPGTGKSQTITNLIADQVAQGRRVLFVCEKRVAIDVVHRRLAQLGLAPLTTLIHDSQGDKKAFVQDLRATYEAWLPEAETAAPPPPADPGLRAALEPLATRWAALRSPAPGSERALGELVERLVELGGGERIELDAVDREALPDHRAFAAALPALRAVEERLAARGVTLGEHPLRWVRPDVLAGEAPMARLAEALDRAIPALERLASAEVGSSLAIVRERSGFVARIAPLVEHGLLALLDRGSALARAVRAHGAELATLRARVAEATETARPWRDALGRPDLRSALALARRFQGSILRFLFPAFWRLRRLLRDRYDFGARALPPTYVEALEDLERRLDAEDAVAAEERKLAAEVGTDPASVLAAVEVADGAPEPITEALRGPEGEARARALLASHADAEAVAESLDPILHGYATEAPAALVGELRRLRADLDALADVAESLAEAHDLAPGALRLLSERRCPVDALERAVLAAVVQRTLAADPVLEGQGIVEVRRQQRAVADREGRARAAHADALVRLCKARFLEHVRLTETPAAKLDPDQKALKKRYRSGRRELEHEMGKVMRYRSIRDLATSDSGLVIRDLKPVWLMSPLSVSDTLPLVGPGGAAPFDVVIFDEASQIPLEDAVPAVCRAPQTVIVGDEMQLPPTTFFGGGGGEENEDAFEVEADDEVVSYRLDADSLLSHASLGLGGAMLQWHYRSRDEALIRFCNHAFYGGRLRTIPSTRAPRPLPPIEVDDAAQGAEGAARLLERPLSFHHLQASPYEKRRNRGEAAYIAEMVRSLLRREDPPTVGIVAFSEAQQSEIEAAIDALGADDPEFRRRYEAELEREVEGEAVGLFVKNLENVQGDERDVIILSVCYGPDARGQMRMNFGPINKMGGEKRLNVIFSRAKEHMAVVSSIRHERITNEWNTGARILKSYLRYAEACSLGDTEEADAVIRGLGGTDAGTAATPHPLVAVLADALRGRGFEVAQGVGTGEFAIDLAIREGDRWTSAVLVDAPHRSPSPDPLAHYHSKPAVLEAFGWHVVSVLPRDWVDDSERVLERLVRQLRQKE